MKEFVIYFKSQNNRNVVSTTKAETIEQAISKAERKCQVNNYKSVHNVFERRTDID